MSRLSLKYGSKLPYWVTFVIDKFAISKLLPEFFRKTYADLPNSEVKLGQYPN
jgi:hypothetical protein